MKTSFYLCLFPLKRITLFAIKLSHLLLHTCASRPCILSIIRLCISCCWWDNCLMDSKQDRISPLSFDIELSQRTTLPLRSVRDCTWWTSRFFTALLVVTWAESLALIEPSKVWKRKIWIDENYMWSSIQSSNTVTNRKNNC